MGEDGINTRRGLSLLLGSLTKGFAQSPGDKSVFGICNDGTGPFSIFFFEELNFAVADRNYFFIILAGCQELLRIGVIFKQFDGKIPTRIFIGNHRILPDQRLNSFDGRFDIFAIMDMDMTHHRITFLIHIDYLAE